MLGTNKDLQYFWTLHWNNFNWIFLNLSLKNLQMNITLKLIFRSGLEITERLAWKRIIQFKFICKMSRVLRMNPKDRINRKPDDRKKPKDRNCKKNWKNEWYCFEPNCLQLRANLKQDLNCLLVWWELVREWYWFSDLILSNLK